MLISSELKISWLLMNQEMLGRGSPVYTTLWITCKIRRQSMIHFSMLLPSILASEPCRARTLLSHSRKSGGSPRGKTFSVA
jgi:hypothetical protein